MYNNYIIHSVCVRGSIRMLLFIETRTNPSPLVGLVAEQQQVRLIVAETIARLSVIRK